MKNMNPNRTALALLSMCMLLLTSCSSTDSGDGASADPIEPIHARPETATSKAKKKLALAYLEKASEQLEEVNDVDMQRKTGLSIAYLYALLSEKDAARRFLNPTPPAPTDERSYNNYIQYLTILATLGDYQQIDANIERLGNPQSEAMIRGFVVYYDAILHRSHLHQSLQDAAMLIDESSDPHSRFYLALGYDAAGNRVESRKTCLKSSDPNARFVTCSYMAATLGMTGALREAAFYLDQAHTELNVLSNKESIDPYTQMIYSRGLALAGRIGEATEIYARLNDKMDAMYVGSVLASQLRATGHATIADSIIRNTKETFSRLKGQTVRKEDLYTCYGDFLTTLELYDTLTTELRQTREPLLKANLLIGGAQALADEVVYGR